MTTTNSSRALFVFLCTGFLIMSFYGNIKISGMSILGAMSSSLGLAVILYSLNKNKTIVILTFFSLNSIIGPFSLINLNDYGFATMGRLDYLFSIALFSFYLFVNKKINIFILLLLLLVNATFLLHKNLTSEVNSLVYSYISVIMQSYLVFIAVKNHLLKKEKSGQNALLKLLMIIFIANIALAYLQIFIPGLHIRNDATMGQTVILGFFINRPTGLYGSAHIFSLATFFYGYIIFILLDARRKSVYVKITYILTFPLIFLSSSGVLLGVFLYLFNFLLLNKLTKPVKIGAVFSFILIIVLMFFYFNMSDLPKSTGTKILIWWLIIQDMVYSSSLLEILFGHGIDSAKFVSLKIPEFLKTYEHGNISYDHEILKRDGFLYTHNIFIQIFYEFGIFMFLLISITSIRNLIFIISYKNFSMVNMLFVAGTANYFFHNGMFSLEWLPILLIIANARKYKAYKLLI